MEHLEDNKERWLLAYILTKHRQFEALEIEGFRTKHQVKLSVIKTCFFLDCTPNELYKTYYQLEKHAVGFHGPFLKCQESGFDWRDMDSITITINNYLEILL